VDVAQWQIVGLFAFDVGSTPTAGWKCMRASLINGVEADWLIHRKV